MCLEADINRLNGRIYNSYVERKNLEKESNQIAYMIEIAMKKSNEMSQKLAAIQQENFMAMQQLQDLLSKTTQYPKPNIETKFRLNEAQQKYNVLIQKQREVDQTFRNTGPIDSLSTESVEEVTLFDTQNLRISEQITKLNDKVDNALTSISENDSKLVISETEFPEFMDTVKEDIKIFEGAISWDTVKHELSRIMEGFDLNQYAITDYIGPLPKTSKELRETLYNIEVSKDNILTLLQKQAVADQQMEDAKKELELAQSQLANEELRSEKAIFQESEINIDIEHCDTQINSKRKEIERIQSVIQSTSKSNGQQSRLKNDLQHNLNDLMMKEKPEIIQLNNEVEQWRVSLKNITDRLDATEEDLQIREEKLKTLTDDKTIREMIRMKEKKEKLEKKISLLKHAIKKEDKPTEDFAQICEQNELKKRTLTEQIEKLERQHKDEQIAIKDLSSYSDSLTAFLRENKKNKI
ncbi:hypothetical protein TVAG_315170 [Trichomonas vaginalis G3]|uniref:Uncharacterized protein n=1 Tax=Trichomonas vaginalis (strain ATCC PRA-98 / G3) TaxID=412133 RepID=A2FDI6_TRIV3|nr:hypothetical protein TVAGG3_0572080 [Trichomonas vaginalis G3]EAX97015.1 hypothetical protein TVAG_315170 [Trichomonas vaginalis G3]KAI5521975.1 hypothetical protein TVAGG3_0572080 [Trichomonas vaginalis G3]|eukprot:XP_001309945.1 hypothetical protein [Trichomonas vaginalis G3]